jgi:hypothetical protein
LGHRLPPALNPVDHLWRHVKALLANEPTPKVVEAVESASAFLIELPPHQRLLKAGILSGDFG